MTSSSDDLPPFNVVRSVPIRVRARLAGALRVLGEARARSEVATRLIARGRIHQDTSITWLDRYPELFASARDLVADGPERRVLSFGCASGEEVLTLRRYFPEATIVGAEINRWLLRRCRRLPTDGSIHFVASTDAAIADYGPYDAIFCMAVLTRRPHEVARRGMRDIRRFYPFERSAAQLAALSEKLRCGGILIVEHTLYRAEDALAKSSMAPVRTHGVARATGPRFYPSGAIIEPSPVVARIFRKASPGTAEKLAASVDHRRWSPD